MKYFLIDEQTLAQLKAIIMETPTKFGLPMGNLLDRGLRPYEPAEQQGDDAEKPAKPE